MMHRKMVCLMALLSGCLVGCGGASRKAAAPAVLTGSDPAVMMAAAQETLERMHFTMDKYDVQAGYLRTRPLRAGQFFEPWRTDNASLSAAGQANIDSLRRTVEVFVEPQEGVVQLRCAVTVEKLSMRPRPIQSTSRLPSMYTDSSRKRQSLAMDEGLMGQTIEWVDLGPDQALEQRILSKIQRQLRKA